MPLLVNWRFNYLLLRDVAARHGNVFGCAEEDRAESAAGTSQNIPIAAAHDRHVGFAVAVVIRRNGLVGGYSERDAGETELTSLNIPSAVAVNGDIGFAVAVVIGLDRSVVGSAELNADES